MADSKVFDIACNLLERETALSRLEARGTIRLALKEAGLTAQTVTVHQMNVVAEKVLPAELETRGVGDSSELVRRLRDELASADVGTTTSIETPEAVFERLGASA